MINVTVAGRLGKDAETRQAGNSSVTGFSVAGDTGFGDKKQSHWFNCSLWGKRGEAMQQYLRKGQEVVVIGEFSEREYNGKQYKELNVLDVKLMGGQSQQQSQPQQQSNSQQRQQPAQRPAQSQAPQNPAMAGGGNGPVDDDIPFNRFYDGQM